MEKELFAYAKEMKKVVHKTNGRHSSLIVTEKDMGAKGFIVGCHTMDPEGFAKVHVHENEAEAMFFYQGKEIDIIGYKQYNIKPKHIMLAPSKIPHSIKNTGKKLLKFIFLYCPFFIKL